MDFQKRYQFDPQTDMVGKGGFAKVFRAFDTVRKRTVALKFYHGNWSDKYDIIGEINRMEDIVHPNLIRYYDATIIESKNVLGENDRIQVGIMEFANAGDFSQLYDIPKVKIELFQKLIIDILEGLKYLHQRQIAHRDLKPKNILLAKIDGVLISKIADFGISKKITESQSGNSSQLLGSVEYMAPEQFNLKKYGKNGMLSTNVDLWSLGVIVYEILTKKTPFGRRTEGVSQENILSNILFKDLTIEWDLLQPPFRKLVERCLEKNAGERAQIADELLDILRGKEEVVEVKKETPKPVINPLLQDLVEEKEEEVPTSISPEPVKEPVQEAKPKEEVKNAATEVLNLEQANTNGSPTVILNKTTPPKEEIDNGATRVIPKVSHETAILNKPQEETIKPNPPKVEKPPVEPAYNPPKPPQTFTPVNRNASNQHLSANQLREIESGMSFFQQKNYIASYKLLSKYLSFSNLNTEAKFYLGYMLYNGKCGGAHDYNLGKSLMDEAKGENRSLVLELMIKYILD